MHPPMHRALCLLLSAAALGVVHPAAGATAPAASNAADPALQRAARTGDLALLAARLQEGSDPNALDPSGRTALLDAVAAGEAEAVRLLLSAGAKVDVATPSGRTPLLEAALQGRLDAARVLIDAGADLDLSQRGWGTALETAERSGNLELAALLRASGARTFGRSVGDSVCVRPWAGDGYCGTVEDVNKTAYRIRVTQLVGCEGGCKARAECSADRPVGGKEGLQVGDQITTVSWCLTHTGVQQ
jgi:Ankyrin repeats (3 copies)